ncbi:MAG: PilN domain-containing protein [Phycisphaeraceae bacterium]
MTTVNLIPTPRRDARKRRVHTQRCLVLCVAYTVVLVAVFAACRITWADADHAVTDELNDAAHQIAGSNRAIAALQSQLADARRTLAADQAITQQPDWSLLLALLANTLSDDVVLRSCQLEPNQDPTAKNQRSSNQAQHVGASVSGRRSYTLRVSGLGRSQAAVSQFVLRLEQTELFGRVALINTVREPFLAGQAFGFQLECELGAQRSSVQ